MHGRLAEWSKALVSGTSHFRGVGSNPTSVKVVTIQINNYYDSYHTFWKG